MTVVNQIYLCILFLKRGGLKYMQALSIIEIKHDYEDKYIKIVNENIMYQMPRYHILFFYNKK